MKAHILHVICIVLVLIIGRTNAFPAVSHYDDMKEYIAKLYDKLSNSLEFEPSGTRGADIVGKDVNGEINAIGEIKKSIEVERDIYKSDKFWKDWNSNQKFGGKPKEFKIASVYSDGGASLSKEARGFAATIDGQLRGYLNLYAERASKKGIDTFIDYGDLVIDNNVNYTKKAEEALDYLVKEGRISGYVKISKNGIVRYRINFLKLKYNPKMLNTLKLLTQTERKPFGLNKVDAIETKLSILTTKTVNNAESIGNKSLSKLKDNYHKLASNTDVNLKTNIGDLSKHTPNALIIADESILSKSVSRLSKMSVAVGIIISGYAITKEIYDSKMKGKEVHPSRIIARALIGYAAFAGFAVLSGMLLSPILSPFVAIPLGFLVGLIGSVAFEWLFELIMPLGGTGWRMLDFVFGGFLGSLLGIFIGPFIACFKRSTSMLSGILLGFVYGGLIGSFAFYLLFYS